MSIGLAVHDSCLLMEVDRRIDRDGLKESNISLFVIYDVVSPAHASL
jgi:hypothetical protein